MGRIIENFDCNDNNVTLTVLSYIQKKGIGIFLVTGKFGGGGQRKNNPKQNCVASMTKRSGKFGKRKRF